MDTNRDGMVTPMDALLVINYLSDQSESSTKADLLSDDDDHADQWDDALLDVVETLF